MVHMTIDDGSIVVLSGENPIIAGAWAFREPTTEELLAELRARNVPMRLIPDNEETVELIAKAIYGEGPTTKHDRIVASAVLAALIGETP